MLHNAESSLLYYVCENQLNQACCLMNVLLFGASGQVGKDCHRYLTDSDYEVVASGRKDTDFSDAEAVSQKVKSTKPDLVINFRG